MCCLCVCSLLLHVLAPCVCVCVCVCVLPVGALLTVPHREVCHCIDLLLYLYFVQREDSFRKHRYRSDPKLWRVPRPPRKGAVKPAEPLPKVYLTDLWKVRSAAVCACVRARVIVLPV